MNAQLKIIIGALLCAMFGGCATNPYSKAMDRAPTLEQKLAIYNGYVATHPLSSEQTVIQQPSTNWDQIQAQASIEASQNDLRQSLSTIEDNQRQAAFAA